MALIDLSALLSDASGSIGSVTVSRVSAGLIAKEKSFPGKKTAFKPSQFQISNQTLFSPVVAKWQQITQAQRSSWQQLAGSFTKKNSLGIKYHSSGYTCFLSCNFFLQLCGVAMISDPLKRYAITQITSFSLVFSHTIGYQMEVDFTGATTKANIYHLVYASPGLSPGISYCKNNYRFITVIPPATADSFDIYTEYIKYFPFPSANKKVFVKLLPINSFNGFAGRESFSEIIMPP